MGLALHAEIPDIVWPLRLDPVPHTLSILDLLEFSYNHVAEPTEVSFHTYFNHSHLTFDREKGQAIFLNHMTHIFSRNGIAFKLQSDGTVVRLAPPVLGEELHRAFFNTGDATLDMLLDNARGRFLDPDPAIRRDALEKLWDAWERLKTLELGVDKKKSIKAILDKAANECNFRKLIDDESIALTSIGNNFRIRHSETTQIEIQTENQVDYLFHRLLALILLLIRSR